MGSVLGRDVASYEAPKYEVLQRYDDTPSWEVRRYAAVIAACYTYRVEQGPSLAFRAIAGYIFGQNTPSPDGPQSLDMTVPVSIEPVSTAIAMTVPVSTEEGRGDRRIMRFFLPSMYTLDTLPVPYKESGVTIEEIKPKTVAALEFSGFASDNFEEQRDLLARKMEEHSIVGDVKKAALLQYNPPWTLPWWRKNEVIIPIIET